MYAEKYTPVRTSTLQGSDELIPVASRWIGSWRLCLERRAYNMAELTEQYDQAASSWHRTLSRIGVTTAYAQLVTDLEKRLNVTDSHSPLRVLECGAGTGALSLALAQTNSYPVQISAVDISPAMLKQADHAFTRAGLSADLIEADIRELPFDSNTQDVVIAAHVLEHLADPNPAFDEIYRVLKPGGLALLCCTRHSLPGKWIQLKWRTHTVTTTRLTQWLKEHDFEQIEPLRIDNQSHLQRLSIAYTATKPHVSA